jgi:[CysO sulfur-carrier protein]-S-L-cysteine hydrolase
MSDHEGVGHESAASSPRRSVCLRAADRDAIFAQAQREYPNECCGVLLGHGDSVEQIRPTANSTGSPVVFEVDPRELLDVLLAAEAESLDVLGYYHSHTASPAYPSPTDVRYAAGWPDAVHLIVSLADALPSLRAFSIETVGESERVTAGGDGTVAGATRRPGAEIRELEVLLR